MESIYAVKSGAKYVQEEMKTLLINESSKHKPDRSFIPKLTRREKEILELILFYAERREVNHKNHCN